MYNNTGAARDLVHFLEDEWIATFLTTIYKYYKHIYIYIQTYTCVCVYVCVYNLSLWHLLKLNFQTDKELDEPVTFIQLLRSFYYYS